MFALAVGEGCGHVSLYLTDHMFLGATELITSRQPISMGSMVLCGQQLVYEEGSNELELTTIIECWHLEVRLTSDFAVWRTG